MLEDKAKDILDICQKRSEYLRSIGKEVPDYIQEIKRSAHKIVTLEQKFNVR